ncbi:MAG TPA: hypothetical protein VFA18_16745 [Gemmataceae bacterium]|nr:hypothetical protein [Gemmataceae bacterium]
MRRFLALAGLAVILGLGSWAVTACTAPPEKNQNAQLGRQAARPGRPASTAPKASQRTENAARLQAPDVYRLLDERITIQFPPNSTIADSIDQLAERCHCLLLVDSLAFSNDPDLKDQFPEGIEKQQLISLPRLHDMRLSEILRLVFTPVGGTFLVRDGAIFIEPERLVASGAFLKQPVTVVFEKVPLTTAFQSLADRTGATIVMDARLDASAVQVPITARFNGVPVQTAARVLANMSGLQLVQVGNALYATDGENAGVLQEELKCHSATTTAGPSLPPPPPPPGKRIPVDNKPHQRL